MSSSTPGQTSIPSSDFRSVLGPALGQALSKYKKKTGNQLLGHALAAELRRCESVDAILAIIQGQAEAFQQFKDGDQRLMKWINPVVDVLYTFSGTLGGASGLVFPPAKIVFTGIGVLLVAAKDVRASHDALVELFERIESFFKRLAVYTQISLTAEMAEVLVKIVSEVLCILSIATKEVKRKRAKIYFRKLLGRTDIEDAFKRLDNLIQEEVRMAIAQTMRDARKANDSIDEIKWNQLEQYIRNWFSPPDPSTNHNTARGVYHNAPPKWFFEAGVFKGWMSDGSLLWVHGKPGSGKSILCSAIIQHVMTLRDAGRATLAYFYFDFRDEKKQTVRDVVTSLLVQLASNSKPCLDIIDRLYSAYGRGAQQPRDGVLIDRLKEMLPVAAQHPIFIIMDALDECPDLGMPTPREAVLNFVKDLVRLQLPNLHICVTSRPETDIQTKLKPLAVNAISLHDESRQKFVIANYVSSVVSSDERMKKWRDEDKKLVVEELSERADGMFQWVFCQLEMLRHAVQPDVRAILEKLPKTLDETYERVLKNINENNREHARRLLHCLAVSVRPLRVEELAEILTFDFDIAQGGIPKFHADRRPRYEEEAVLSICSSLITIVDNRGSRLVQFSHLSVKEFLTSNYLASSIGNLTPYHILPGPAHTILAQVSLGLLLHLDGRNDNKSVKGSPLAEYAARHWVAHAQFEDVASRVEEGMKSLFDLDKPHFMAWIGLYDIDAESGGKLPSEIPSPLYYSALCGFHGLLRHIVMKHPQDVNAIGGSFGFPLVAALCKNHFAVVELLLEHGASVDVRDTRKQTALHRAIDRHDKLAIDAVQFLLKHGADVNAQRDDSWTPLHLAANLGELSVTQILLGNQADVNSRNGDGQAPLHLFSRRETFQDEDDSPDIAKLLLERGANVNVKDKDNATPLHFACLNMRLKIVRVLLDHGADAEAEKDQGETPLQIVLRGDHNAHEDAVGIAQLLLEHGAEAYARDKYHISTSDLACCLGKEKVGQVLLGDGEIFKPKIIRDQTALRLWIEECGVDGKVQDKYDTILLHSASYHGRLETVRNLLDHGVKSNAKNHRGETALHVVSRGRYDPQDDGVHVAQLLLKRGADVNAQDEDHDSPLHYASYSGKLEIARVLLSDGAKANAKNEWGGTPLHQVSQGEYESQADGVHLAQLLLDHGVDVNAQDKDGVTALHLASWHGKLEISRLLLKHAISKDNRVRTSFHVGLEERTVDVQQKEHETPLHFACLRGKPEIARLLLDHGARVNAKNDQGETPLHLVSRGQFDSPNDGILVAKLLLACGGDVNAQTMDHWTPLHSASYNGNSEIMQDLLRHGAKVDVENDLGETPLHLARQGKSNSQDSVVAPSVAQLLLDRGVDVNVQDRRNWTPLHAASYYGRFEIAQVLLDRGAIAKAEDGQGKTPLHQVSQGNFESQEGGVRIAELLLERGKGANVQDKNGETPLHVASRCGSLEIVRVFLEHATVTNARSRTTSHLGLEGCGADVNALAENNWTPLHSASSWGRHEVARLLLDHGAKEDAETDDGETPLHAVANGKYETKEDGVRVAQLLLERGVDANAHCKDHWTPLHVASFCEKLEIVRLLLDHGANANTEGNKGETPLHRVSRGKYNSQDGVRIGQLLLERSADVNAQDEDQRTPLHVASYDGKIEIAQLLLDHGAKVDAVDDFGNTPLHEVSGGKYDSEDAGVWVAWLLLEHGGDVNGRRIGKDLRTPLHAASYNGKLKVAQMLIDYGAKVDAVDDFGNTPLHEVSQGQYDSEEAGVHVARLLLERGGDVNGQRNDLWTPLHFASYNGKFDIAQLLLDNSANLDAVNDFGKTPLHEVSAGKYESEGAGVRVAQLILERGGDVNRRSKAQKTPLHFASNSGKPEIARLLLEHGAKVDAVDDSGSTPLHQVSASKFYSEEAGVGLARLLLERGGDVNGQTKTQWTPLHFASYTGKLEIARLLLEHGAKVNAVNIFGEIPLHDLIGGKYDSEAAGVGVARLLLEHGGDVNGQTKRQRTPLHVASHNGKLEIAQLLLENSAKLDAVDDLGNTPLHDVSGGKYDSEEAGVGIARLLLERGGDVNGRRKDLRTPLHVASYHGRFEITQLLLDRGAKLDTVNDFGDTPLHEVSAGKFYSEEAGVGVARLLLERGGYVNGRRKDLRTPLHLASYYGLLEIVRLLLECGEKVDAVDDSGNTPLHDVSVGKYDSGEAGVGVARLLLERGGDVNGQNKKQRTPLHVASNFGNLEIAQLLLSRGAKLDAVDDSGNTPLHEVSAGKHDSEEAGVGVARLLLERGGDVNGQPKEPWTPLHVASYYGKLEIARVLLGHGAKADALANLGYTPLHAVARGEYDSEEAGIGIARLLLEHGADVNAKARFGLTPFDSLSRRTKRPKLTQFLIEHAADAKARRPKARSRFFKRNSSNRPEAAQIDSTEP